MSSGSHAQRSGLPVVIDGTVTVNGRVYVDSEYINMADRFGQHFTDDGLPGDGTNQRINLANGSLGAPVEYWVQGQAGYILEIHRLIFSIQDNKGWYSDRFAGLAAALANGFKFEYRDGVTADLLDGDTIKTNLDLHALMYDADYVEYGNGLDGLVGRWTFTKDTGGHPLTLAEGDKLVIIVQDDLRLISDFHVHARGLRRAI